MHNNKKAFIRLEQTTEDSVNFGCSCAGYYLLELNQSTLRKMGFAWECGSFSKVTIFELEPVVVPMVTVLSKEEK